MKQFHSIFVAKTDHLVHLVTELFTSNDVLGD